MRSDSTQPAARQVVTNAVLGPAPPSTRAAEQGQDSQHFVNLIAPLKTFIGMVHSNLSTSFVPGMSADSDATSPQSYHVVCTYTYCILYGLN